MSYYEHHVFFCCNQREPGAKVCCNGAGATELREYAKGKVKELKLAGKGRCASIRPAASIAAKRARSSSSTRTRPGTPMSTRKTSTRSSSEHLVNGRVVERLRI